MNCISVESNGHKFIIVYNDDKSIDAYNKIYEWYNNDIIDIDSAMGIIWLIFAISKKKQRF